MYELTKSMNPHEVKEKFTFGTDWDTDNDMLLLLITDDENLAIEKLKQWRKDFMCDYNAHLAEKEREK